MNNPIEILSYSCYIEYCTSKCTDILPS